MPAEPRFPQPVHQRGYILRTEGENWNTDTSGTWTDVETIMLSEKSQTQKATQRKIPFIRHVGRRQIHGERTQIGRWRAGCGAWSRGCFTERSFLSG